MNKALKALIMLAISAYVASICACDQNQSKDPVAVTKAVLDSINKGRADIAAGCFSEDSEFISSFGQPKGKVKIEKFFNLNLIALKTKIETHEISANGQIVAGTFTLQSAHFVPVPTLMDVFAEVVDGKVKSMTWSTHKTTTD